MERVIEEMEKYLKALNMAGKRGDFSSSSSSLANPWQKEEKWKVKGRRKKKRNERFLSLFQREKINCQESLPEMKEDAFDSITCELGDGHMWHVGSH